MSNQKVVGVCGTHGKSTTTAMVAYILAKAGLDPTYLGGAKILGGENFHRGKGDYFVVESDEYNDNFLNYPLYLSACVSIEFDHPSYFKNFNHYLSSFEKFVRQGKVFVGYIGDLGVQKLIKRLRGWERDISGFRKLYQWELLLPGRHSRINAQAAYLTAKELGVPDSEIRKALATFPGIERRLELVGVRHGRKIYSDYGHHPTEIKATIQALRELYPKEKVILIFQPHTFARIEALFWDFVSVFRALPVEELVITDVFNRRREEGKVSSKDLVQAVGLPQVDYLRKEKVPQLINGSDKDVVVLMGAGDIDQLAEKL
jgi:UDP-N-acetylmuramate--alanine ligase